ncbi:MAG: TetR/AcrR family transcriptional regulator [Chloroflexota bacterium]
MDDLPAETADRILAAFLELVAERGIESTTMRQLAEKAGVNEVTIFRHFGNKRTLARAAVGREQPAAVVAAYPLAIDVSSLEQAAAGLLQVLRFLRRTLKEHRALLQFGMGEYWRFPELTEEIGKAPLAARDLVERALVQAAPALRPEVDPGVSAIGFVGLVFVSVTWQARGWLQWSDEEWDRALQAAIRPLIAEDGRPEMTG